MRLFILCAECVLGWGRLIVLCPCRHAGSIHHRISPRILESAGLSVRHPVQPQFWDEDTQGEPQASSDRAQPEHSLSLPTAAPCFLPNLQLLLPRDLADGSRITTERDKNHGDSCPLVPRQVLYERKCKYSQHCREAVFILLER